MQLKQAMSAAPPASPRLGGLAKLLFSSSWSPCGSLPVYQRPSSQEFGRAALGSYFPSLEHNASVKCTESE